MVLEPWGRSRSFLGWSWDAGVGLPPLLQVADCLLHTLPETRGWGAGISLKQRVHAVLVPCRASGLPSPPAALGEKL